MKYNIIASGSKANCVTYLDNMIMVDCGVSYKHIKTIEKDVKIVLISHEHGDHLNVATLRKLQFERPALRIACGGWLTEKLIGLKNVDVLKLGNTYNYGSFKIVPIKLYHDVFNFGFRIITDDYKIFHATDTKHLQGISAKNYDLYAIESNYDEEKAIESIEESRKTGEYCHAFGSINSHLSHRQAWEFIHSNRKEDSEVIKLHMSESYS